MPDSTLVARRPARASSGFFVIPVVGLPRRLRRRRLRRRAAARRRAARLAGTTATPCRRSASRIADRARRSACWPPLTWAVGVVADMTVLLALSARRCPTACRTSSAASRRGVRRRGRRRGRPRWSGPCSCSSVAWSSTATPTRDDLAWGVLAGVGSGFGTAFLYRGFAAGRMGVVAPSRPSAPRWCPVVVGLVGGERPAGLVWLGIAAAFPGIWWSRRTPAAGRPRCPRGCPSTASWRAWASACCSPPSARSRRRPGCWPLALTQAVAAAAVIVRLAVALRAPWVPRERPEACGRGLRRPGRRGDRGCSCWPPSRCAHRRRRCWPRSTPRSRSCWPPWCCRSASTGRRGSAWPCARVAVALVAAG